MSLSPTRHPAPVLVLAVVLIATAVFGLSTLQRRAAEHAAEDSSRAQAMLTGMLDQETGLRGFALTRRDDFLEPYRFGREQYLDALAAARRKVPLGSPERDALMRQAFASAQWRSLASKQIAALRRGNPRLRLSDALARKRWMDRFRAANADFQDEVRAASASEQRDAGVTSVLATLALAVVFGGLGGWLIRRNGQAMQARRRRERQYMETQQEFAETMQVVDGEEEAHRLLKRHLERSVEGSVITVLNRNNSDDRLEPVTPVPAGTRLAEALADATPRSCVAVRLGRRYEQSDAQEPLVPCDVCGGRPGTSTCQPLLVSGKVIGSVLVEHPGPLREEEGKRIDESVAQAAPVLANLRNLAIAESRASTDALTGLANRRAVSDNLRRMAAQASRSMEPLAAITLDIDHFKTINDRHGHDKGDEVLAAVGALLARTVRTSDFVGRLGGEEFVILAPATGVEGATVLAENLRAGIERLLPDGLEGPVTASFGVCVLPDHAVAPDALMRLADRALYAAKSAGRNCVRMVERRAEPAAEPVRRA